jgi:hypothetical protein
MTAASLRRRAVWQALGLIALVAGLSGTAAWWRLQPDGPDGVKVPISLLRSQSAELQLLAAAQAGHRLPPRFVTAHASQLAGAVDKAREQLRQLRPLPALAGLQAQVNLLGADLAGDVDGLQSHPRVPPPLRPERTETLVHAEQALQR